MLGFQTLSCLHDIPVIRSSTTKVQEVYSKAKDTTVFIRLPCSFAETLTNRGLRVALKIVNPFVKSFSEPMHILDNHAAETIRQLEHKYPIINSSTDNIINTFNVITKPVLNVINSVKDKTTSAIQYGRESVSNVATTMVNTASGVAASIFTFYETHAPKIQQRDSSDLTGAKDRIVLTIYSLFNYIILQLQPSLIWFRIMLLEFLVKTEIAYDFLFVNLQQKPYFNVISEVFDMIGTFLENITRPIKSKWVESSASETRPIKHQLNSESETITSRSVKSNLFSKIRKFIAINEQEQNTQPRDQYDDNSVFEQVRSNISDLEELRCHLVFKNTSQPDDPTETDVLLAKSTEHILSTDVEQPHADQNPIDLENLCLESTDDVQQSSNDNEIPTNDQLDLPENSLETNSERLDNAAEDNSGEH